MQKLLSEVLQPVARRLGSLGAGAVLAFGATQANSAIIEEAIVATGLVVIDLVLSHANRRLNK